MQERREEGMMRTVSAGEECGSYGFCWLNKIKNKSMDSFKQRSTPILNSSKQCNERKASKLVYTLFLLEKMYDS